MRIILHLPGWDGMDLNVYPDSSRIQAVHRTAEGATSFNGEGALASVLEALLDDIARRGYEPPKGEA